MDSVRWKFEDVLAYTWIRDARLFHYLENWEPDPQLPGATIYLTKIQTFQRHNVTSAYRIAGVVTEQNGSNSNKSAKNKTVRPEFASKISKAFLDALYAFLDGLVHLASDDWQDLSKSSVVDPSRTLINRDIDISSTHTRLLLVLSNLGNLSQTLIPNMFNQMEIVFGSSAEEERQTLAAVLVEVDRTLFDDYAKQTAMNLTRLIREGIMDTNMDWFETPRPTEVRPYIFETLMYLVSVHAHVNTVAKSLLERTLNSLIEDLIDEALACFRQVRRFGMGGMLRATLEMEFMHKVLQPYVTKKADAQLKEIYKKISESYVRRGEDDNLQEALEGVKKTLSDTRKATGIEFLCFRGPGKSSESSGKSERNRNREVKEGREGRRS
ncbi:hypothetical protein M422DRAFT_258163 [Sphaerobolus stellatus SS14]|uniref:Exocyst complex component SEC5 n=1 Tax=Sphaerobolus stellatus (strain SS14) TaxID=990650 RepID=A0A0C9VM82_SPHS4|nr:hypothetical protein M422DRAFT_258163 [Sphaerobolus stellatus SS14]